METLTQSTKSLPRTTLLFLQATAFLNAVGFGIIGPVSPFLAQRFAGDATQTAAVIGWLASSFALCAFLSAPVLGALSDRFGRRPVLIISLLGTVAGYAIFGLAGSLWMLFLGRIVDGLTAGNIGALFAYLGDTTKPEDRGRTFGLIGASFGAGFIVGPAIGGLASKISLQAPFLIAAVVILVSAVWGYFSLPESLPPERRTRDLKISQLNPFTQLAGVFKMAGLRPYLIASVLFFIAFVGLQTTLALLVKDVLGWGPDTTGYMFIAVGVTDILVQGVALSWLLKTLRERGVTMLGFSLVIGGLLTMALLPLHRSAALLIAGVIAFAGGEGMATATLGAMTSQAAGPEAQGRVQGGSQALQSLSSALIPLGAAQLYAHLGPPSPYWAGAVSVALAVVVLLGLTRPSQPAPSPADVAV
jgi:MFS transporter, DHA1 family, tetracycline resistance protein